MKDKYLETLTRIADSKKRNKTKQNKEENMNIEKILQDRNATHGDFREGAKISQHLKKVVGTYGEHLTPTHRESLDMIMHKVARLLNGDPMHMDTWTDIIGYATLAVEDIEASKLDDLRQDNAV